MRPLSEQDLAEAIISAEGPLNIIGGGTRLVREGGTPLYTGGLSGINLYEPGALTMVAKAGTPLSEINAALDAEGQRLAFEPPDMRGLLGTTGEPTIGGVFATNASGPRRIAVGAARDFLLGVRCVDGSGNIVKNGGRVMKNVTGYDLVKLMAGSWGTLGVLSEVSFKVLPKPEAQGIVSIDGLSVEQAVATMSRALGSPYDVSGAAHLTETSNDQPDTILRVEGTEASVTYRMEQLKTLLNDFGDVTMLLAKPDHWNWVRDLHHWESGEEDIWRISTKPSSAPEIVGRLPANTRVMLDWGGGLIWAATDRGTDLRAALRPLDGHATLVRGTGFPRAHPEPAGIADLSASIRRKFDPRGILNPGRMG